MSVRYVLCVLSDHWQLQVFLFSSLSTLSLTLSSGFLFCCGMLAISGWNDRSHRVSRRACRRLCTNCHTRHQEGPQVPEQSSTGESRKRLVQISNGFLSVSFFFTGPSRFTSTSTWFLMPTYLWFSSLLLGVLPLTFSLRTNLSVRPLISSVTFFSLLLNCWLLIIYHNPIDVSLL